MVMADGTSGNSWLDRLRQAFAQPVERLGDVESLLLGAGTVPPMSRQQTQVLAANNPAPQAAMACVVPGVPARDNSYFHRYYEPVASGAAQHGVNPAFVLANGYESGYADPGIPHNTYTRTGDAFGMTGGSTANMTRALSPQENVDQFFDNYGSQVRGVGDDRDAYVNALRGRDSSGAAVRGWRTYNQEGKNGQGDPQWNAKIRASMARMAREVPIYAQYCAPGAKKNDH
jgi:hypothetical protein